MVAVVKANRPNRKDTKEDKAAAHAAWDELWTEFRQFLEPRAAKLADAYGYSGTLYTTLCLRPDLVDHVEVCPALGPFLDADTAQQIPASGWNLQQVAGFLIAPPAKNGEAKTPVKVSPGFMAWARGLTWDVSQLPPFPKDAAARAPALRAFIRIAQELGTQIDPNGIQQIANKDAWKKVNFPMDTDKAWLLLNSAIASRQTVCLVPHILKNPAGAVKAVERYFPPDMRLKTRDKITKVFETVMEWVIESDEATRIARTPGVLKRYPAFTKLTEEARVWDRAMRDEELRQLQAREAEIARRAADQELQAQLAHERALAVVANARTRGARYLLPETIDPAKQFPVAPQVKHFRDERYQIIYLSSGAMLQEESVVMNHCVAAFHSKNCVDGDEMVFSIRPAADVNAQPLATMALNPRTGALMEMQGKGNHGMPDGVREWALEAGRNIMAQGLQVEPEFQTRLATGRRH